MKRFVVGWFSIWILIEHDVLGETISMTDCERHYHGTCINMYFNSCLSGSTSTLSGCGFQEMCCIPPANQKLTPPIKDGECGLAFPFPSTRIVGGTQALRGEFPWQVSLRSYTNRRHHTCGGILVDGNFVLTAAHCFDSNKNPHAWTAILGEYDRAYTEGYERLVKVETIYIHNGYSQGNGADIAMVYITPGVKNYTASIRPACLPSKGESFVHVTCTVTGWGSDIQGGATSRYLQKVDIPILSNDTCNFLLDRPLTPGEYCAGYRQGGHDSCQGDSGVPMVCYRGSHWTVAGIVSWGIGCANAYLPGVYTDVAYYSGALSWHHSECFYTSSFQRGSIKRWNVFIKWFSLINTSGNQNFGTNTDSVFTLGCLHLPVFWPGSV